MEGTVISKNTSKRTKILIGAGAIVGAIALYMIVEHFLYVTTDNAQVEAHTVLLAPKVSGYITEVAAQEGGAVKKGDVLVSLDDRDYQNALQSAQGELGSMKAKRADAEKNFRRLSDLVSKGAISQQQFDNSKAQFDEVKSRFDALSAQVSQAELNLLNTKIRAPSDGRIARRAAEVGQLAAPGMALVGFVSSEGRWITANFKETEIQDIEVGNAVKIEVDGVAGHTYKGKVDSIFPATGARFTLLPPDNATGNFTKVVQRVPVKVVLTDLTPADIDLLRAGLSAYVKVRRK